MGGGERVRAVAAVCAASAFRAASALRARTAPVRSMTTSGSSYSRRRTRRTPSAPVPAEMASVNAVPRRREAARGVCCSVARMSEAAWVTAVNGTSMGSWSSGRPAARQASVSVAGVWGVTSRRPRTIPAAPAARQWATNSPAGVAGSHSPLVRTSSVRPM